MRDKGAVHPGAAAMGWNNDGRRAVRRALRIWIPLAAVAAAVLAGRGAGGTEPAYPTPGELRERMTRLARQHPALASEGTIGYM